MTQGRRDPLDLPGSLERPVCQEPKEGMGVLELLVLKGLKETKVTLDPMDLLGLLVGMANMESEAH